MSEQTKEADIVERLRKEHERLCAHGDNWGAGQYEDLLKVPTVFSKAAIEITRLRAERPGWAEAIEAAAKCAELFLSMAATCEMDVDTFGGLVAEGTLPEQIRALHPSVAASGEPKQECQHEYIAHDDKGWECILCGSKT